VTDFGLARLAGDAGPTRTGDLLGTLRYMSPEQALGRPGLVDHRTDVYSLGASLYELLTLRPPFPTEEKVELLRAIADDEPVPPRRIDRAVPAELETVVLKAMAKCPADRYTTARKLADDLRRFVDDRPILARPPTPAQRLRRWARKHRSAVWAAAAAATGVLLTVLVGLAASNLAIASERDKARQAEAERTGQLYDALVNQAQAKRLAGRVGARAEALRAIGAAAPLIPVLQYGRDQELLLRNEALACLALPDTAVERRWRGYPAGSWAVALDAGFAHYARSDDENGIVVRRVADDAEVFRAAVTGALPVLLSSDGRFLAASHRRPGGQFGDANRLTTVWDISSGQAVLQCDGQRGLDFSPDGRRLAIAEPDGTARVYELPGVVERAAVRTGQAVRRGACRLRLGPGGKRLAAWGGPGGLEIWDVDPPRLLKTLPNFASGFPGAAWHPDGSRLAVGYGSGAVHLHDATVNWGMMPSSVRHPGLSGLRFDPTGDLLLTESSDNTTRVWDVSGPSPRGRQLEEVVGTLVPPCFRADGRAVAVRLGWEMQVVRVEPSAECRVLDHFPSGITAHKSVGYSRDGRVLVSPAANEVRLWDLASGRELARLPGSMVGLHPGGEWLLTLGVKGVHRWPIRTTRVGGNERWDIGPPATVALPEGTPRGRLWSGHPCEGGHALAIGSADELMIVNLTAGTLRRVPMPGYAVLAMTADGRRAVAQAEQLPWPWRVLDVETGRVVFEALDVKPTSRSYQFSPDGQVLAVCTPGEVALYDAGSGAPRGRFSYADVTDRILPQVAFAPDGRALAVAGVRRGLQLLDPATGDEIATLSAPGDPQLSKPSFSPDGRWLTAHARPLDVCVWDLPRLGGRLGGLGLADGWPLTPPAEPPAAGSVTVEVDLGELAGAVPPADRGVKKSNPKP
jgi:WD40 repeat protein